MPSRFQPGIDLTAVPGPDALLFAFAGDRLLVVADSPAGADHLGELASNALYIGRLRAVELAELKRNLDDLARHIGPIGLAARRLDATVGCA